MDAVLLPAGRAGEVVQGSALLAPEQRVVHLNVLSALNAPGHSSLGWDREVKGAKKTFENLWQLNVEN